MPEKMTPQLERADAPENDIGQEPAISPDELSLSLEKSEFSQITKLYQSIARGELPKDEKLPKQREIDSFSIGILGYCPSDYYFPKNISEMPENITFYSRLDEVKVDKSDRKPFVFQVLPDRTFISADSSGSIYHWCCKDPDTNTWRSEFIDFTTRITVLHATPSGEIFTGDENGGVTVYRKNQFVEGRVSPKTIKNCESRITGIQQLPDGDVLFSMATGTKIQVFSENDKGDWNKKTEIDFPGEVNLFRSLPDGRTMAICSNNAIYINNGKGEEPEFVGRPGDANGLSLVFDISMLPDGRIISCGAENRIRIWSRNKKGEWKQQKERGLDIACLARSILALPNGTFVTGADDGTVSLWWFEFGSLLHTEIDFRKSRIEDIQMTRDGNLWLSDAWGNLNILRAREDDEDEFGKEENA